VRRFPLLERYGLVFVWTGEAEAADPSSLIEIAQFGADDWGVSRGYHHFHATYLNIIDNLIDPAHTSFVHRRTIGSAAAEDIAIGAEEQGDTVRAGRWVNDAPPVPVVKRFAAPAGNVDRWQFYYLRAPSVSWVDFGSFDTGTDHTRECQDAAPYRVLSYAFLTPETRDRTHYFWFQLRNFQATDQAVTAEFEALYRATFDEDKTLLEAIQRTEERNPGLQPMRIASDAGVARMRRILERRLGEEAAGKA
jgi:vanillate O-demethylase monooxygenase subunit